VSIAPAGTRVSLFNNSTNAVSASRMARLFAAANPRLRSEATSLTAGQCCLTTAGVPSDEALSTTVIRCATAGGAAAIDARQASTSALVLNDTMMTVTSRMRLRAC
jgi:hypothetical protein